MLRELANKFALFFLPVFLFQLGMSNQFLASQGLTEFQSGIVLMSLYLAGVRLSALLLSLPSGNFIRKYGFTAALILSHLLYAVMLVVFRVSLADFRWLLLGMFADGVSTTLMWGSFHTIFSKHAQKARMGRDLGFIQVLMNFIWMIAPALSGIVIFLLGYEVLFSVGLVVVGLIIILATFLDVPHERDTISFKELAFWVSERKFVKLSTSIAGKTLYDVAIFVWPLYVFLLLGNTERVGILYSLSFLLSMILSLFIGTKLDHQERKRPFFISGGLMSILWAVRSQIASFWSIALVDAFDKVTGNFHWLFFDRVLMNRGKGREAFSYFVYREMIISVTVVVFWSIFALAFLIWPLEWKGLFVMAAVGVLMSLLISKKHE
jgi:MFS family permease